MDSFTFKIDDDLIKCCSGKVEQIFQILRTLKKLCVFSFFLKKIFSLSKILKLRFFLLIHIF